ncbi:hypothetical protein AB0C02_15520 [Micromonospora sp. NPDC048999]|uniref:hypothetical protein n=1 Tax=Micromonospora sp. NPDC048999 TaxID=3155391 RepID=UPI0034057A2F
MSTSSSATSNTRALWLAISILAALHLGTAAGVIKWVGSHDPGDAVLFGAASFAGTLALSITAINFVMRRDG